MLTKQSNEVPHLLQKRICQLAQSLPTNKQQSEKIIQRYSQQKGYQFLNPKSKLYKHFIHKYHISSDQRNKGMEMDNQMSVTMIGNIQQLSVGAMCEILKQNIRKGNNPYQPTVGDQYQQQFIFQRDEELFNKSISILHNIKLSKLEQKHKNIQNNDTTVIINPIDKNHEFRKQMTVKQDGSLGVWGGKKYEGLGTQNQFTSFRKQQSMNYYHNTFHQTNDRKKQ